MKLSELWLREWVDPKLTHEQLCEQLTMAGLEVEALTPVAEKFTGIVVAKVLKVEKHPEADRLHVCEVDAGQSEILTIVCGAKNVKAEMKVAAALEGATLANDLKIKTSKVRGVTSQGMLCSASELGLADESDGLFELPEEAVIGETVWEYLKLSDHVIDVSITPNRGDCLSVMGMAKEISALTQAKISIPEIPTIAPTIKDQIPVVIHAPTDCPRYVGRVIRQVQADATTPMWMQERLRRSGLRKINPIVDVMNYVMLELGQPLHAFDLQKIHGGIEVRKANKNEELQLLDGNTVKLSPETLVIADQTKPLVIAGVMGGLESGVTLLTKDIFLESAYFSPNCIARAGRHYGIGSDSSYRYERGIDPTLQAIAIERATKLLLDIVGGQPGPLIEVCDEEFLPTPAVIKLRTERMTKLLGVVISHHTVENILERLSFKLEKITDGWMVTVPARRSDITLEVDLIEEIARLSGYDKLPTHYTKAELQIHSSPENKIASSLFKRVLCDLGYQEVVTYSFVDKKLQALFDPQSEPKELLNPITSEMAVMRTNLWSGLVNTLLYNQNRQQPRARIFETGLRFIERDGKLLQQRVLSGLVAGSAFPEQWGVPVRSVDFFDLKGDLENLLKLSLDSDQFDLKTGVHPALHPGQTAEIYRNNQYVGVLGALHPTLVKTLDVQNKVFLFELILESLETKRVPRVATLSKFPEIRRDIAIIVDQVVSSQSIRDIIKKVAGEWLKDVNVFDVYQGKGITEGRKSIALSLTLQHSSRTLVDEEVADIIERVIVILREQFAAELRG